MAMEEIIVRLGVDSSGFVRVLDQANEKIDQAGGFVDKLGGKLAALVSVAALTNLAKQAIDYASDMNDAAEATRTGVEEYQVLAQVARESGASLQQLDQALIKSTLSGEKAAEGNKEMKASFAALNIDVAKFNELPTEKKLEAIGAAYNNAGASQEAYAAVTEILGVKAAPRLISALQQLGTEGFDAVRVKAEEAGVVLNKIDAQKLDHLADQMTSFKVRTLVIVDEVISSWDRFFQYIGGKSREQIYGEEMDPARAAARQEAIRQLAEEDLRAYNERMMALGPMAMSPLGRLVGDGFVKQAENEAAIEERITAIVAARRAEENEVTAAKQEQFAAASRQREIEQSNADTANAVKMVEEGRALIRLKEMTDQERLLELQEKHTQAVEVFNNMLLLGEGTDKEKEAIAKRVLEIEKQISDTKSKIDADTLKAAEDREKKEEKLLDLLEKEAAIMAAMGQQDFERYGRDTGDLATGGGGGINSTLGRLASDEQRLSDTAQRQFDELSRARARAAAGDEDAAREVDRLQDQFDETEARRQGLEDQVTEAQGGSTGDPLVDKMEDVRKEIEEMREDLGAA